MRAQINSLQYCRALAALAVLAQHSLIATTAFVGSMPHLVEAVASRGFLGVDFFFVLSGFIITHAHMDDALTLQAATLYITKRLRRIYVPYLPVSLGLIALYLVLPAVSKGSRDWGLLTSLTLIPTEYPPALVVAWTLSHEIIFYTLFLLYYCTRRFPLIILAWMIGIVGLWTLETTPTLPILRYLLSPLNLEFIVGMASAYAYKRISAGWATILVAAAIAGLLIFFLGSETDPNRIWFGLLLAPLLTGVALLERSRSWAPAKWFLILGNASYAVYLVHDPVVSVLIRVSAPLHSWAASFALCIVGGTIFGIGYHFLIERPALRFVTGLSRAKLSDRPTASPTAGSSG